MNLARFFSIAFVLTLPFFTFAQTTLTEAEILELLRQTSQTTTSTAVQPPDLLEQLNALQLNSTKTLTDYTLQLVPTIRELRTKSAVDDIVIETAPKYPGPNETINAVVRGYLVDLNRATISWSINGRVVDQGVGKKTFSFQNSESGKTTTLTAVINTRDGIYIKKELSFTPMGATISWEADTYTPPFYKGKPLLSPEARVRVIVFPDTGTPGNFVYEWEKDTTSIVSASGYGKNSFSFSGPIPFGETGVRVHVSSLNKTQKSTKKINLTLSQPFILFYENHPLLGVWYNFPIYTNLTIAKKELSISAEPYFFSNETTEKPTFLYNWSLNGSTVGNPGRIITLRNEQGEKSSSSIALAIRGLAQTFQLASRSITINFVADESARPSF